MAKTERSQRIEVLKKEFLKKLDTDGNFLGLRSTSDGVYYPPNSAAFEQNEPSRFARFEGPLSTNTIKLWLIALTAVSAVYFIILISIMASMPKNYGGKEATQIPVHFKNTRFFAIFC